MNVLFSIVLSFAFLVLALGAPAKAAPWEAGMRDRLCPPDGREVPVEPRRLPGRPSAADCVIDEHAIEIDSSDHWKQAIGQALYYASQLEKKPGLILVCRRKEKLCLDDKYRVEAALSYSKVEATVWFCVESVPSLDTCVRQEFGKP